MFVPSAGLLFNALSNKTGPLNGVGPAQLRNPRMLFFSSQILVVLTNILFCVKGVGAIVEGLVLVDPVR